MMSGVRMERMSLIDASFLYMENEFDLHHNAWLGIFEGPAPTGEEFRRHIASKLPRIPRYRQRVRFVPHDLAAPVWVDDQHFNLGYHVRSIALPSPGSEEQLRELFTTLMAQPLDRNKPLWDMWLIDGLEGNRWALISRLHHCMADGVSTTDITTTVLDREPAAATPAFVDHWKAEASPTDAELVQTALIESQQQGLEQASRYNTLVNSLKSQMAEVDRAFASLKNSLANPLSITSLNGPIGPYRRWAWAKVSLANIAAIRAFGGTVNDIVLTIVTRAFRDLLLSRGEEVADRTVRCLVPVSVRSIGEEGGNRIASMYAELPVGIADPKERLANVRAQMDGLKASKQALAADVLASLAGFQPPALMAMSARQASHAPNPVNTVATNVPGPQHPLFLLGRKMLDNYPYVPLASTMRLGTSVFSYDGYARFGVSGDYESMPDINVFADGLKEGIRELIEAAAAEPTRTKSDT
jgi:diacylglycerol O-acyltransferase / wax synthase